MSDSPGKIAVVHGGGLRGWARGSAPSIEKVMGVLASEYEIHYFGPPPRGCAEEGLPRNIVHHDMPSLAKSSMSGLNRLLSGVRRYFVMYFVALKCRRLGVQLLWYDDYVPLIAPVLRFFLGHRVVVSVRRFPRIICFKPFPVLGDLCEGLERVDVQAWCRSASLLVGNHAVSDILAGRGVPRSIMHVLPSSVDHETYHPIGDMERRAVRRRLGLASDDIVITLHGVRQASQAHLWVLKQLAELHRRLPRLKLLVIGRRRSVRRLEELAGEMGVVMSTIFSVLEGDDPEVLNELICAGDIGLGLCGERDLNHFGLHDVVVREMACAKPVLAVDHDGVAELVEHGRTGFVIPFECADSFRRRLVELYAYPERCLRFGEAALQRSRELHGEERAAVRLARQLRGCVMTEPDSGELSGRLAEVSS